MQKDYLPLSKKKKNIWGGAHQDDVSGILDFWAVGGVF